MQHCARCSCLTGLGRERRCPWRRGSLIKKMPVCKTAENVPQRKDLCIENSGAWMSRWRTWPVSQLVTTWLCGDVSWLPTLLLISKKYLYSMQSASYGQPVKSVARHYCMENIQQDNTTAIRCLHGSSSAKYQHICSEKTSLQFRFPVDRDAMISMEATGCMLKVFYLNKQHPLIDLQTKAVVGCDQLSQMKVTRLLHLYTVAFPFVSLSAGTEGMSLSADLPLGIWASQLCHLLKQPQ
ncbi:hypothetical protein JOB18_043754 [Solea senegalensis]|uniref:Uncharacterized protein n=1 Tax=Solea senegalensis TaxID=28829 RepID=A0AAV6SPX5_SOLSE|nr:hypothetical protein JOB18_043754 [Solea senegalensis]